MSKKLTIKEFIFKAKQIHGDKYDYSKTKYNGSHNPVTINCLRHGKFTQSALSHIYTGRGCPICGREKCELAWKYTQEEFLHRSNQVHGKIYDYSKANYKHNNIKIEIICPKHGSFFPTPNNFLNNKSGCPSCNTSVGEELISKTLQNKNLQFDYQKRFPTCRSKNNRMLSFDFYIPSHNLLIEYDGEHHFKPCYFNGYKTSQNDLEIIRERDKIKTKWTKNNGVHLLRIPYWKLKNIEIILNKHL
jgi:hypothetical protein